MTAGTDDRDSFAVTLQAAYHDVRLHSPQGIDDVEQRLRAGRRDCPRQGSLA
jgi:hypothetical protein